MPGPGIDLFELSKVFSLERNPNEVFYNMEGSSYVPGAGFLFFLDATKGPVTSISYLPFPNPKPFLIFFLN